VPEVYALHHRLVDLEGDVHVGGHLYSVPYQLIGRRVEVRETKDHVRVFEGPRQVAVHERVLTGENRRVTVPEHRPPRGACAAHVRPCRPKRKSSRAPSPCSPRTPPH
jgi:Mu transposase-like protein